MRPIERVLIVGGVVAAIVISLSGRLGESGAYASAPGRAPVMPKIATVDVYVIAEGMMEAADLKKIRNDAASAWQIKSEAIAKELKELDTDLSILPQNDPKVQEILKKAQVKQQDYQKLLQDRQADLERINSTQLIEAYGRIRTVVEATAKRLEYTHVFCNREHSRQITTHTLSQTLQELLARPIINSSQTDDLTKGIMEELKLVAPPKPGG